MGLFSAWAVLSAIPHRALAQDPVPVAQDAIHQPVTFSIDGPTQRLEMVVATSRILTLEHKIPRLLVNNPEVVRATPISPNQIQLSALQPGVTQLNVWDENQGLYTVDVVVTPDGRALQMLIKSEFPDAAVRVRPLSNSVYLSGYVPSPAMVNSIVRIAEDYYPKVVNNMTIGGVQQILLKTKVMEVSRTKLRRAGFDWAFLNNEVAVIQTVSGLLAGGATAGAAAATGGDTVRFGIVDGDSSFSGFIDALRQNDLIKILAEPQLTTVSGRPASFNSGGEFPIIVPQSLGTVSIEYRQYGTRVDFVPIVLGNGNLRLEVRPQVSEIDASRSVVLNSVSVPGLRTRWVDTAVEMKAGQTLALGRLAADARGSPEPRAALAGRHPLVRCAVPPCDRRSQRGGTVDSGHARVRGSGAIRKNCRRAVPANRPPVRTTSSCTSAVTWKFPSAAKTAVARSARVADAERDMPAPQEVPAARGPAAAASDVDASAKRPAPAGQPATTQDGPVHGNQSVPRLPVDATRGQAETGADRPGRLRCAEMTEEAVATMTNVLRLAIVDPNDAHRESLKKMLLGMDMCWLEAESSRV